MASPEPRVVKKSGEGYDRPAGDQELPIDINYQKLSEWLVTRQKLPGDWHKRVQAIQAKITEALKDLPAGTMAQLPGGQDAPMDYLMAVQIRDKLAETGERTLFGGLSGQASIWDKIVKAYENGGVFIGEAAQTMVQNVDYEIPYLRKQMAKCTQQLADADRRHAEYTRNAAACASNYKKECEKLGISGAAVGQELQQLGKQLPTMFEQLVEQLRSSKLQETISYYQHFTSYAHGSEAGKAVSSHGAGRADSAATAAAGTGAGGTSIDWGDVGEAANNSTASTAAAGGINWGMETFETPGPGTAGAAGISWDLGDIDMSAGADAGAAGGSDAAGGISWDLALEPPADDAAAADAAGAGGPSLDWDIDTSGIGLESAGIATEASAGAGSIDWGIEAEPASAGPTLNPTAAGGGGSCDASASRLQHDPDYRSQLLDDLQELRAFLIIRKGGLSGSSSNADLLRALAPELVAATDLGGVLQMLQTVDGLIAALNDDKLRQLLMISSSSRYLERLSSNLQRKAGQESKMLAAAAETQARKQESRATLVSLQPKLADIVERTRSIKQSVEVALSKQFSGRRVNILGEVNNALAGVS
eukprot:gene8742-8922_t